MHPKLVLAAILSAVAIVLSVAAAPRLLVMERDEADQERNRIVDAVRFVSKELSTAPRDERNERRLVRITTAPVHIVAPPATRGLCVARVTQPKPSPHNDHWIDVYVSRNGSEVMTSGSGTYPQGTMILKRKYQDSERRTTELFTGMLKREKGYNSDLGDWQFFVLDSKAEKVTEFGRLVSCMDCHAAFGKSDFVSRKYLATVTMR